MLASRQVLGNVVRSRALGSAATGIRRLATVSDSPLDQKVSFFFAVMLSVSRWVFGDRRTVLSLLDRLGPFTRKHQPRNQSHANQSRAI